MLDRTIFALRSAVSLVVVGVALAAPAAAGERFVYAPFSELRFQGEGPKLPLEQDNWRRISSPFYTRSMFTYAVLDAPGEVYVTSEGQMNDLWSRRFSQSIGLAARTSDDKPIRGRLFVADGETKAIRTYRFEIAVPAPDVDHPSRFWEAKALYYDDLLQSGVPGTAWFRHQRDEARKALGQTGADSNWGAMQRDPADLLDLFTGGRAIAENLDLDRALRVAKTEDETIDVSSITGVTTRAMDWKALVKDMKPELDPLARFVPADQHAVFFPSFEALTRVVDDLDSTGTTLIEAFEVRVEDQMTKDRYQKQMCLPLSTLGRALGPTVVSSIAMTGSDPFLPSGADLAILFDCKLPDVLEKFIGLRQAEAEKTGADRATGKVGGFSYEGAVSADRSVSCYMARVDSVVVVANSLQSLVRVLETAKDSSKSLLGADEYVWFRDRYKRGTDGESAFIVLTDATIRRWAGPRSRIGDARRLLAAAAMNEIQARNADAIVTGKLEMGAKAADPALPISADFVWDQNGVRSPRFGTLRFLTPISELGVDKVSAAERDAYQQFQRGFQQRWSNYFDPIAVRLAFDDGRMKADVTVMPLTIQTDYREIRELTGDGKLPPAAGDPHTGTLFHFASALSKSSELGKLLTEATGPTASRFGADPLAWMGESFAIYGERDPWWDVVQQAGGLDEAEDVDWYKLPLVLQFDVKDPLKLAVFLTALRAFADESGPNLVKWTTRTWHDVTYVCITPSEALGMDEPGRDPHLFYAALPDMLVLSLREDLIQKSIDRRAARKEGKPVEGGDLAWLGKSAGLRVDGDALDVVLDVMGEWTDREAQAVWSTIPIQNEWKRRFPGEDPVQVHQRLFGVRLTTPSKKPLVWNEALQSMESPEYGVPGAPKQPGTPRNAFRSISRVDLGVEFENDGLRAVAEVKRAR